MATITAEILAPMRMVFRGPSGISMGFHRGPEVNHDYVEAQSRFTCDGEVGYGLTERSVELFAQQRREVRIGGALKFVELSHQHFVRGPHGIAC